MKSQSKWITLLIVVAAILALGWTGSNRNIETNKWEYMSYRASSTGPSDPEMNKFGAEGWELVAVDSPSETSAPRYVFKRRK